MSAKRHATAREIKLNSEEDELLTLSLVQNDCPRLMYNLIFSSLGKGIGQRETVRRTFCSATIKSPIWKKEHIGTNTLNTALNVGTVLLAGQQLLTPLFKVHNLRLIFILFGPVYCKVTQF